MDNNVKFVWNGIKVNGTLYKGSYTTGPYTEASGLPAGTVTIYINRSNTPRDVGLEIQNNSDITTDYFESDTVHVRPGSEYYEAATAAAKAYEIHYTKLAIKNSEKMLARFIGTGHPMETFHQQELSNRRAILAKLTASTPKKCHSAPCK